MAEIVLSQAGAALGAAALPSGLTVFGQTIGGAALGRALGGLAGRAIDAALAPATEGPRIKSLNIMESREGAGLPLVYGRMRVGGQVIWASQFREKRKERSGGKGGPKYAEYSYTVSFAVALCQGPVTRIDRIWANGENIALSEINWRLYQGDEAQLPDPLIEAVEGSAGAPAYRGTAYVVFEDLALDRFGNRLPQLSFEVVRAGAGDPESLRARVRGVNVIPASGEFVYGTQIVRERRFPGIERALNMNNGEGRADFAVSLDQLRADLPRVDRAALTVAWFADSVSAGTCRIAPGVETRERETVPYGWSVDGTGRGSAHLVSQTGGRANYGGTPADRCVLEGLRALHAAGLGVTLSPFLLVDAAGFPWRGRIGVSSDGTPAARAEIDSFVGSDGGFGFRHFILHHARLAALAGAGGYPVEAILIGSEMVTLTRVRDGAGVFPFVEALVALAGEVRAIVGPGVKVSYAADWTEYGAYVPGNGSGDVLFPLDALWASPQVDFVGIDWYPPAGDWRDGATHLDALAGYGAADASDYLAANMAGGEAFDWYYASPADRDAQVRTAIVDTAYGEDWVFGPKNLAGWWGAAHYPRPGGVRALAPTGWTPGLKPVRLCEIGFPAVDRGGNAPNLFVDPKSAESALPPYSSGARDDLYQRRALVAALSHWQGAGLVEAALVWAWDGRPWPAYPGRTDIWSDGENWQFGHWLNGRTGLIELSEVVADLGARSWVGVDASQLEGFVEGFAVDGVTDLRSALSPLAAAFMIDCIERGGDLIMRHGGRGPVTAIDRAELLAESERWSQGVLDKQADRLVLTYVSGGGDYAPAIAEARAQAAGRSDTIGLALPLVMGEGRAREIAAMLLAKARETRSGTISTGPRGLAIEPGDRVSLGDGQVWQVTQIADTQLRRELQVTRAGNGPGRARSVEAGNVGALADVPAAPVLLVIDGPTLPRITRAVPVLAVSADPWPGRISITAGPDDASQVERAVATTPAMIGRLLGELGSGPLGRWDEGSVLEVEMPGGALSSLGGLAVLNGAGLLLVEGADGWELLAYRLAELVGEDRWTLRGLLRGLSGSMPAGAAIGASVVVVDDRLLAADLDEAQAGLPLLWRAGASEAVNAAFSNVAGLSWRVGHLRAVSSPPGWSVSWTRRGSDISANWDVPEAENAACFAVEVRLGGELVEVFRTETGAALITAVGDEVRVARVGADGRTGVWSSIPLPTG